MDCIIVLLRRNCIQIELQLAANSNVVFHSDEGYRLNDATEDWRKIQKEK